jgi:hypothetical protein
MEDAIELSEELVMLTEENIDLGQLKKYSTL